MTYRVEIYFNDDVPSVKMEFWNCEESMEEVCADLVRAKFRNFIDGKGSAVIVNMENVTKIKVEEVQ